MIYYQKKIFFYFGFLISFFLHFVIFVFCGRFLFVDKKLKNCENKTINVSLISIDEISIGKNQRKKFFVKNKIETKTKKNINENQLKLSDEKNEITEKKLDFSYKSESFLNLNEILEIEFSNFGKMNFLNFRFSDNGSKEILQIYLEAIYKKIERNKLYPEIARKRKNEGNVKISFYVDKSGNIFDIKILEKSDYKSLDEAALITIQNISPLDRLPHSINVTYLKINIILAFRL